MVHLLDKRCEQLDVQYKAAGKVSSLMIACKVFQSVALA